MTKAPSTTKRNVLKAIRRAARLGGELFAKANGFRTGKYVIVWKGLRLPSKAILGVAAERTAGSFSGGLAHAVRVLRALGFKVVALRSIALIACSASKRAVTSAARDLYIGDMFRKAVAFATRKLDGFAILSAKHGLTQADEQVAPYDERLSSRKAERADWEAGVLAALRTTYDEGVTFVLLCGKDYRTAIEASDLPTEFPLAGCRGLGDMKSWLAAAAA